MFFKSKKQIEIDNAAFNHVQKKRKENLEDFILILQQIQDANNFKIKGKGNFIKSSIKRQLLIENIVSMAIEATKEKIMELG